MTGLPPPLPLAEQLKALKKPADSVDQDAMKTLSYTLSAQELIKAIDADLLPAKGSIAWSDFGFSHCADEREEGRLFSIYVGLVKGFEVDAPLLGQALQFSKLPQLIKSRYEDIPTANQGIYYPWLLEKEAQLFPPVEAVVGGTS